MHYNSGRHPQFLVPCKGCADFLKMGWQLLQRKVCFWDCAQAMSLSVPFCMATDNAVWNASGMCNCFLENTVMTLEKFNEAQLAEPSSRHVSHSFCIETNSRIRTDRLDIRLTDGDNVCIVGVNETDQEKVVPASPACQGKVRCAQERNLNMPGRTKLCTVQNAKSAAAGRNIAYRIIRGNVIEQWYCGLYYSFLLCLTLFRMLFASIRCIACFLGVLMLANM